MNNETPKKKSKKDYMVLYRIVDEKPWPRIGAAFKNYDGSFNLLIEAPIGVNDQLQLRLPKAKNKKQSETN